MEEVEEKSQRLPLRVVTWITTALMPSRHQEYNVDHELDDIRTTTRQIIHTSLIQGARDGLIEIVQWHLRYGGVNVITDVDEEGFTALHLAAKYNRVKVLELLTKAGADLNVQGGQDKATPLHLACRYNSASAAQFLLGSQADVNAKDSKKKTPLHYATRRGDSILAKLMLSSSWCNVNASDADHITPLHMAAMQGNLVVSEILITRGAIICSRDINQMTPLMWACAEGHPRVVKFFLNTVRKHGVDKVIMFIELTDNEGNTALHLAAQNGNYEVVELLLNNRANVNCQKLNMATPLHLATMQGFIDVAGLLIIRGADVNKRDAEQMTPVHTAALYNRVHLLDMLFHHGANLDSGDKKNLTPLHCACWKGQADVVRYLLRHSAHNEFVDSSLKTALHWAVQNDHFDVLNVLLENGGDGLIHEVDKNDQTVLHYAARTGNTDVLKKLLSLGAKPSATDEDEYTPLHIATMFGNVDCVSALIAASKLETNDDDSDGRTPLLLGCAHGHDQVVQVLISLGADVSKSDGDHCTALMLAAAKGHLKVMRILLDNHASVNAVDNIRNTALHYACANGHTEAVKILLQKNADVTLKNTQDHTPIDLAVDNQHVDVTIAMLDDHSWRNTLIMHSNLKVMPFDRLIMKVPQAAQVVLDKCLERNSRDSEDPNLIMTLDYQFVDPGPDAVSSEDNKRYFALNTMVAFKRELLLSHPVCRSVLSQKWMRFGRLIFYCNLFVNFLYVVSLTTYAFAIHVVTEDVYASQPMNNTCSIYFPRDERVARKSSYEEYKSPKRVPRMISSRLSLSMAEILICFFVMFLIREVFKINNMRLSYVWDFRSWVSWVLMISTMVFITPLGRSPCLAQWRGGSIALFVGWINFMMYLTRIEFVGFYIIMFVTVVTSSLKAFFVYVLFACAFSGSFFIVTVKQDMFDDVGTVLVEMLVMSLRNFKYTRYFAVKEGLTGYFSYDTHILIGIFVFLMSLVVTNLLIGVAVGDIEKIRHEAYLKKISLEVDLLYNLERHLPLFLQRKFHIRRTTIRPNQIGATAVQKLHSTLLGRIGDIGNLQSRDRMQRQLHEYSEEVEQQQQRLGILQELILQQGATILEIANKLNISQQTEEIDGKEQPSHINIFDYKAMRKGSLVNDDLPVFPIIV